MIQHPRQLHRGASGGIHCTTEYMQMHNQQENAIL